MLMTPENLKKLGSVALTTFLGAFIGYLMPSLLRTGIPTTEAQWEAVLITGALAGVSALVHLYQAPPAGSAAAVAMAAKLGHPPVPPASTHGFVLPRVMAAIALLMTLGVSVAPAFLARAHVPRFPSVALTGCTPAQSAADAKVAQTVLTDAQKACVDIEAALPFIDSALGLPAVTVTDVDAACGIVNIADTVVQSEMATGAAAAPTVMAKAKARAQRLKAAAPQ